MMKTLYDEDKLRSLSELDLYKLRARLAEEERTAAMDIAEISRKIGKLKKEKSEKVAVAKVVLRTMEIIDSICESEHGPNDVCERIGDERREPRPTTRLRVVGRSSLRIKKQAPKRPTRTEGMLQRFKAIEICISTQGTALRKRDIARLLGMGIQTVNNTVSAMCVDGILSKEEGSDQYPRYGLVSKEQTEDEADSQAQLDFSAENTEQPPSEEETSPDPSSPEPSPLKQKRTAKKTHERMEKIKVYVEAQRGGWFRVTDVARATGIKQHQVMYILNRLHQEGKIDRDKVSHRDIRWKEVREEPQEPSIPHDAVSSVSLGPQPGELATAP